METLIIIGLITATIIDTKKRKIPNWLTFSLIIIGFIYNVILFGSQGAITSLSGLIAGIALLYLPFALGGMGGGDVKLLGALGAFLGAPLVFKVFIATTIWGGVFSAFEISKQKAWSSIFSSIRERLIFSALNQKLVPEDKVVFIKKRIYIPYALSMTLGYLTILCLEVF